MRCDSTRAAPCSTDDRLGVAALIVPADPGITVPDIDRACRAALGAFKIPRTVAFVDALPRLGTQKVDLARCRELLLEAVRTPAAPPRK